MRTFCYPATVTVDTAGFFLVTFPDVPEAGTDAETREEALHNAVDALIAALGGYIQARRTLPLPSPAQPRQVLILVEWESRAAFEGYRQDPALADLHPHREAGTSAYVWHLFDRLDDLRPLLRP